MEDSRGTCLRVDLDAIAHNTRVLKARMGKSVRLMAVVKANAYGHGLIETAKTVLRNGAKWLAVAIPEEGMRLRGAGINAPVLVLGNVTPAGAALSVRYGLTQTVCDVSGVELLEKVCEETGRTIDVHLKLDTGMNRIGARTEEEVLETLAVLNAAARVHLTGTYTHFADADDADESFSHEQFERFERLSALLPKGLLRHAAASDASLRFPWARLDMVREGIALYGCAQGYEDLDLRPAMQMETRVTFVKEIGAGETVGYGRSFKAEHPMKIATIAVGYGDGYPRACSGRASVLLHGKLCPQIGRVCMDQMMADVSDVPDVRPGDTAVLMGKQGDLRITAGMLAEWAGTISYEILLSPSTRVPVLYDGDKEGI